MNKGISDAASHMRDEIKDVIKDEKSILITTHNDCDGIVSGSIIAKMLQRMGASYTIRVANQFTTDTINNLAKGNHKLHIITDMASEFSSEMSSKLDKKWFIIDHHPVPKTEKDDSRLINSWKMGMDGSKEICAGGMAYLLAKEIDDTNEDLAHIAVVAALGDRQDVGQKKSLDGMNQEIVAMAEKNHTIQTKMDLLLAKSNSLPLADALSLTTQPFIEGLVWNKSACVTVIESTGIMLKDKSRWRKPSELSLEEKEKFIDVLAKFSPNTNIKGHLEGNAYTLTHEITNEPLYDAREFATMLNACGKIRGAGAGIAVCMGDRGKLYQETIKILQEYNSTIQNCVQMLSNERWRINNSDTYVMINGEGIVPDSLTGVISALLTGSHKNYSKIIMLWTDSKEGTVKFSARKPVNCTLDTNLQELFVKGISEVGGSGGGHSTAASARILKEKTRDFAEYLENHVGMQDRDSSG
ncbi:MAG: DHH family phosphoesterase [Candidatus Nitrosoabyssus spongiisocia]|nr:MAG: DHH family phosphoesterase [Nitrosopumilaceae archaeon AB1(1)]